MMFVVADSSDVVPDGGLMAQVALLHIRVFHACDLFRNHVKVLHIMTGRSLMALRTVEG